MDPISIWFIIGGGFVLIFVYVLIQFVVFKAVSKHPLDMHGGMMKDAQMPREEETMAHSVVVKCADCGKENPISNRFCGDCGKNL